MGPTVGVRRFLATLGVARVPGPGFSLVDPTAHGHNRLLAGQHSKTGKAQPSTTSRASASRKAGRAAAPRATRHSEGAGRGRLPGVAPLGLLSTGFGRFLPGKSCGHERETGRTCAVRPRRARVSHLADRASHSKRGTCGQDCLAARRRSGSTRASPLSARPRPRSPAVSRASRPGRLPPGPAPRRTAGEAAPACGPACWPRRGRGRARSHGLRCAGTDRRDGRPTR
jgi:hypothetical protein